MSSSPFLRSIRSYMLVRQYSPRTIKSYLYWIKYYIVFHGKQHPKDLGERDVESFLTYLAENRSVSASTQAKTGRRGYFLTTPPDTGFTGLTQQGESPIPLICRAIRSFKAASERPECVLPAWVEQSDIQPGCVTA